MWICTRPCARSRSAIPRRGCSACACRPGLVRLGNDCVNPDSHPGACGPTAAVCGGATPRCENGVCVAQCSGGFDTCGNACVNPDTDPDHCGGCGNACNNDEVCVQGNCENFDAAVGWFRLALDVLSSIRVADPAPGEDVPDGVLAVDDLPGWMSQLGTARKFMEHWMTHPSPRGI